ncbi:DUF6907 domain-containing protein [Nocardiopsis deserti]|uniref:DUF6907 domain-containing protein n=1 Tax=Nocardiopsis deserti TaxID=2605988 RepID=UPI00123A041F|nr:hypothetical protein [Nocardiopsis deserti]
MTNTNTSTANRPYWQDRPCPEWCHAFHGSNDSIVDARHSSGTAERMTLSTEENRRATIPQADGSNRYELVPAEVETYLEQHHLHMFPRVVLSVDPEGGDTPHRTVHLTLDEARLLAGQINGFVDTGEGHDPQTLQNAATADLYVQLAEVLTELDRRSGLDPSQEVKAEHAGIDQDPDDGEYRVRYVSEAAHAAALEELGDS